jgi:uncharacterized protein YdiU (UPF0061 family)
MSLRRRAPPFWCGSQHSHIRFGTFQRLAYFERPDLMAISSSSTSAPPITRNTFELSGEARAAAMFGEIVEASARLAGSWMGAGFVHGVLNTDNLNVTGESFDYGPWRFLPTSEPKFHRRLFR